MTYLTFSGDIAIIEWRLKLLLNIKDYEAKKKFKKIDFRKFAKNNYFQGYLFKFCDSCLKMSALVQLKMGIKLRL